MLAGSQALASGRVVQETEVTVRRVRADGNCLFAAIGTQHSAASSARVADGMPSVGHAYRGMCMKLMRAKAVAEPGEGDLPFATTLRAATGLSPQQYFSLMEAGSADDSRTWGGILEAGVIASRCNLRVAFLERVREGYVVLAVTGRGEHRIAVVWNGTHYDIATVANSAAAAVFEE